MVLLVLYVIFPLVWMALIDVVQEHIALSRAQWHRHRLSNQHHHYNTQPAALDSDNDPVDALDAAEYIDYTPAASPRVRILHPQNSEALARLLSDGQRDPAVVSQIVVPSSVQYPNVSAERPIVITTYR